MPRYRVGVSLTLKDRGFNKGILRATAGVQKSGKDMRRTAEAAGVFGRRTARAGSLVRRAAGHVKGLGPGRGPNGIANRTAGRGIDRFGRVTVRRMRDAQRAVSGLSRR